MSDVGTSQVIAGNRQVHSSARTMDSTQSSTNGQGTAAPLIYFADSAKVVYGWLPWPSFSVWLVPVR